eukprot:scaffold32581_cov124-Isochrysis_galbana.AAC.3
MIISHRSAKTWSRLGAGEAGAVNVATSQQHSAQCAAQQQQRSSQQTAAHSTSYRNNKSKSSYAHAKRSGFRKQLNVRPYGARHTAIIFNGL